MLYADGKNSSTNERTCRKDVLRLLKNDLNEFYRNTRCDDETVSSYYIKTIFLHLLEEQPQHWSSELIRVRYTDALSRIVSCFQRRFVEHYFIADENILDEKYIPEKHLSDISRYFLEKHRYYIQKLSPRGHGLGLEVPRGQQSSCARP